MINEKYKILRNIYIGTAIISIIPFTQYILDILNTGSLYLGGTLIGFNLLDYGVEINLILFLSFMFLFLGTNFYKIEVVSLIFLCFFFTSIFLFLGEKLSLNYAILLLWLVKPLSLIGIGFFLLKVKLKGIQPRE